MARHTGGGLLGRAFGASLLILIALLPVAGEAVQVNLALFGDVSFPDADPDLEAQVGPESIWLRVRVTGWPPGNPWVLTLSADSDLSSGPDVIPASNVSWTAIPNPPFQDGTLSTTVPVIVASGTSPTNRLARFDFFLQNSWNYNVGNYAATATFTLSSP